MAYTTINKSKDYFNTLDYNGNGSNRTIIDVGFQPDLTWIKHRNGTSNHNLFDVIRGATKYIESSSTAPNQTGSDRLTGFASDGFDLGSNAGVNGSGQTYVSWNWKANGAGSSNTDGSITSTVSANTTGGFSIVKYTGTGSAGTIGHGLGVAPACILFKNITTNGVDWFVYHKSTGATNRTKLNQNVASSSSSFINNTSPSSTVFNTEGGGATGTNANDFIAYCFTEKTGYSKFGSYTGNGNADGTFVYTGFKPAFILQKRIDNAGSWNILDNKREGYNVDNNRLFPDTTGAENTLDIVDILSNGFKWRNTGSNYNNNGETNIYMAFAEAPLVGSNNVPCTAR